MPAREQVVGAATSGFVAVPFRPLRKESRRPGTRVQFTAFPMMPGMPEKRAHNYLRHSTTSLRLCDHEQQVGVMTAFSFSGQPRS